MAYELSKTEEGTLSVKGHSVRFMLVPSSMLVKVHEELKKVLGPAADIIMRKVGEGLGEAVVEVVKKEEGSSIDSIKRFLEKCGFGSVEIIPDKDCFTIVIRKAPSLDFNTGTCRFEEGVIKALLELLNGEKWKVKTVKAEGEDCVIKALRE